MAKGGGKSAQTDDWQCCEVCSYVFTIIVGILFFLAGSGMAVYAGLFLFGQITIDIEEIGVLASTDTLQWGIFIVGLCIAGTSLLGMITAGCAKCAANPDGKNDCCEKFCTAALSILYITILSVMLAATLIIAGGLSYYAVLINDGSSTTCPYTDSTARFVSPDNGGTSPDPLSCPLDYAIYEAFFSTNEWSTVAEGWKLAQDISLTCGYFCDNGDSCSPSDGADYAIQTTGTFCTENVTQTNITQWRITNAESDYQPVEGQPSTQAYRPVMFEILFTFLIPFLAVWWCIFVLALLLIIAACVMCIRKSKKKKESTYKP